MPRLGILDTTFARYDMGSEAIAQIRAHDDSVEILRYTVPGILDLPLGCKKLIEEKGCDGVLALGMVGKSPIDKNCALAASLGMIWVQLLTNKHVIQAIVHEDEASSDQELIRICIDRARKHALNLLKLVKSPQELISQAGTGRRQGYPDVGPLRI